MSTSKKHATLSDTLAMVELLKQHFIILDEVDDKGRKIGKYRHDWDDMKIAQAVAPYLTRNHVCRIRQDQFGYSKPQSEAADNRGKGRADDNKRGRIDRLEVKLNELARELGYVWKEAHEEHD